jgi:integrase
VRLATSSELDLDAALWTIPAERMKARREHVVPLPPRAVEILKTLRPRSPNPAPLVFADAQTGSALSENRFLNARDDLGYRDRCMPHGFRSSFRDWAAEETTFSSEVVEMALAHAIPNKVEAAYRRGDLLAKRRKLMQSWAKYATTVHKVNEE